MNNFSNARMQESIERAVADFFEREFRGQFFTTVLGSELNADSEKISILVSVLPEKDKQEFTEALMEQQYPLIEFLHKRIKGAKLPTISFEVTGGTFIATNESTS